MNLGYYLIFFIVIVISFVTFFGKKNYKKEFFDIHDEPTVYKNIVILFELVSSLSDINNDDFYAKDGDDNYYNLTIDTDKSEIDISVIPEGTDILINTNKIVVSDPNIKQSDIKFYQKKNNNEEFLITEIDLGEFSGDTLKIAKIFTKTHENLGTT